MELLVEAFIFIWHLIIGWFGVFMWSFGLFHIEKDKADNANQKLDWEDYKQKNWDNWVWTAICAIPVVLFEDVILGIIFFTWSELPPIKDAVFLLAGPLSLAIVWGIKWIKNKFQ